MSESIENVVIIGTGPAGLTAAIYTARANLNPLVISGTLPGGQLTQTTDIENYPGFVQGINGFELMMQIQQQAERFGTRIEYDEVTQVSCKEGGPHTITLGSGNIIQTKALIIATGAQPRWLNVPGEEKLKNKGISACATCDGAFFRDVPVVVVGGGDTAVEEALFLTRFASSVTLIHRRDSLRASQAMQDRLQKNEKVTCLWDSVIEEVCGDEHVESIKVKNVKTGIISDLACRAVFVAIGHVPTTHLFDGQLEMHDGYITRINPGRSFTSVSGVFVAGDCSDHVYRQAIHAAGMGCEAAIDAEHWLAEING